MDQTKQPVTASEPLKPGFLMAPLGWLAECLSATIKSNAELLTAIFELDAYRMHLLGLGLAHLDAAVPSRTLLESLPDRSLRDTVRQILENWPQGLDRALQALPDIGPMAPESYRALVMLLQDKATAAYIHHCRALTEPLIVALASLPSALRRPPIFKLFDDVDAMDRFVAGLQFLSDRAGVIFDHLVEDLGSLDQVEQIRAKIVELADQLPLPDRLPAERLGIFHRIDDPVQIRSLAKAWQNCLGEYLHEVNEGTSLIYRSNEGEQPTAALLVRVNRLGWALVHIKGPQNVDLDPNTKARHHEAFVQAGVPLLADVAAIRSLLWRRKFSRSR